MTMWGMELSVFMKMDQMADISIKTQIRQDSFAKGWKRADNSSLEKKFNLLKSCQETQRACCPLLYHKIQSSPDLSSHRLGLVFWVADTQECWPNWLFNVLLQKTKEKTFQIPLKWKKNNFGWRSEECRRILCKNISNFRCESYLRFIDGHSKKRQMPSLIIWRPKICTATPSLNISASQREEASMAGLCVEKRNWMWKGGGIDSFELVAY